MKNNVLSASALLLALTAGAAIAAPPQTPQEDPMGKQPTADRSMAQSGTMSAAQSKFDLLDADHNGSIDKQEAAVSKALTAEFSKIDANNDGKLSLTEFATVKDLASIKVDNKSNGY